MSLLHLGGSAGADDKLYVEDVFSAYVRVGTGADVTVNTGIDMTKGYMLWSKGRSGATDHAIYDSARGVTKDLVTNSTAAETTQATGLKSVSTTGHTIGALAKMNTSSATYVDWVMRKAPKFFDIVTYTGNGVAGRQIAHSLGCEVGMIVVKCTSASGDDWYVYHKSLGVVDYLMLNMTNAKQSAGGYYVTATTDINFTLGIGQMVNRSESTYVAYLFAHDTSADGIIQCGAFTTTDGMGSANIGFEPQYIMVKGATITGDWEIYDNMRGVTISNTSGTYINTAQRLKANLANTEDTFNVGVGINQTGFNYNNGSASNTYIYLAIRRQMKTPTSGTEVYKAIARTGTGVAATVSGVGFAPDLAIAKDRGNTTISWTSWYDKLRGPNKTIFSNNTDSESSDISGLNSFSMDGVVLGTDGSWERINSSPKPYINHFFKRAKGFMDIVCYTGTGVARTVNHNLGVVPELMIVKKRIGSADGGWYVYSSFLGASKELLLNTNLPAMSDGAYLWNSTAPTLSTFSIGTDTLVNASTHTFVTYLFATCPNVSKVFSYTGNGSSLNVECGFSAGARFVLCKRTDSNGDWFVFDSVRGIVASNDPHLSLNTTASEVTTDDSIDPYANGFTVNQNATTNLNVNGGTYIGLAIA